MMIWSALRPRTIVAAAHVAAAWRSRTGDPAVCAEPAVFPALPLRFAPTGGREPAGPGLGCAQADPDGR
jgi:hypothetical protein